MEAVKDTSVETGVLRPVSLTEEMYNKDLTTLEIFELTNQIQFFFRQKEVPHYVKFKISLLLDALLPTSKKFQEINNELISKYGYSDGTIEEYIFPEDKKEREKNGETVRRFKNENYVKLRDELKPIEEDKHRIEFKRLPLSSIAKLEGVGVPAVYKLFREDDNAEKIFLKMLDAMAKEGDEKK